MTTYFARYKTPGGIPRRSGTKMKILRRKTTTTNPALAALKKAILNPFSVGIAPKIPDGKAWLSTAMKLQSVSEIKFGVDHSLIPEVPNGFDDATKFPSYQAHDSVELLFFPGFNNMLLIKQDAPTNPMTWWKCDEGGYNPAVNGQYPFGDYGRQLDWNIPVPLYQHNSLRLGEYIPIDDNVPTGTQNPDDPAPFRVRGGSETVIQPEENSRIDKWRLVSCGLKISCVNNAASNAGWYEAARITIPKNGQEWALQPQPWGPFFASAVQNTNDPNAGEEKGLQAWTEKTALYVTSKYTFLDSFLNPGGLPRPQSRPPGLKGWPSRLPYVDSASDMENNPTYTSGKLRDMHKIMFKLRPLTDEHEYKDVPTKFARHDGGNNWPFGTPIEAESRADLTPYLSNNASSLVDDVFDAIHIKIHAEDGVRLLIHYVANQELVYDENSIVQRVATRNVMAGHDRDIAYIYNSSIPGAAAPSSSVSTRILSLPVRKRRMTQRKGYKRRC